MAGLSRTGYVCCDKVYKIKYLCMYIFPIFEINVYDKHIFIGFRLPPDGACKGLNLVFSSLLNIHSFMERVSDVLRLYLRNHL